MTGNHPENRNHSENNGVDGRRMDELSVLATTRGLDQLTAEEEKVLSAALTKSHFQELKGASEQASRLAAVVSAAITSDELPAASPELRALLEARLEANSICPAKTPDKVATTQDLLARRARMRNWGLLGTVCAIAGLILFLQFPVAWSHRRLVRLIDAPRPDRSERVLISGMKQPEPAGNAARQEVPAMSGPTNPGVADTRSLPADGAKSAPDPTQEVEHGRYVTVAPQVLHSTRGANQALVQQTGEAEVHATELQSARIKVAGRSTIRGRDEAPNETAPQYVPPTALPTTQPAPSPTATVSDVNAGKEFVDESQVPAETRLLSKQPATKLAITGPATTDDYITIPNPQGDSRSTNQQTRRQVLIAPADSKGWYDRRGEAEEEYSAAPESKEQLRQKRLEDRVAFAEREHRKSSGETYDVIHENPFRLVRDEPLSTFSVDVDTASYANVRRFLTQGQLPPANAVRIEELLNYFSYDYSEPAGKDPFSANLEVTECPWRPENRLLRVALKGRDIPQESRASSNLVFLIDVSGSMQPENKLPLIQTALKMLVRELTESDRVSIVTYAGDAGLKLPSTNGTEQRRILSTIDSLSAGGSTHGSAGIELAYEQASQYVIPKGTNRVILLTDGDLNVGITDDDALVKLIQEKAKSGVFLTVLGVGEGNLKDSKMEKLADHGNGIYAYLDSVREARKVLVEQMTGSLITIAKDVKFQIEFNPAQVQAYRLIGYENRVLANRDFNDDKKDAGEIGAGHTVTALYELVPAGAARSPAAEPLKYQPERSAEKTTSTEDDGETKRTSSEELLTLKLRFKQPESDRSELREFPLTDRGGNFSEASTDFRFAGSVAMFGMVLRNSGFRGNATLSAVEEIAASSLGPDAGGYRAEFVDLVRKADQLK